MEEKNNSIVRRYVGYMRYDTDEQAEILNEMNDRVRLLISYFFPSMRLVSKERVGSRVPKRYDVPQTPCHRLLSSEHVSEVVKRKLTMQFSQLNPAELHLQIRRLQSRLYRMVTNKIQTAEEDAG